MTYMKEIRQLESQLAAFDIASEVDAHKKIDILNSLAWMLSDTDLKRAYELSETAYDLASSLEEDGSSNQIGMAYSLRTMGYLNQRFGNYDLGLAQLLDALAIFEPLDLYDGLADVFDGIAGIYGQIGNLPEALTYMYKQLDAAKSIGDKKRIANANNNLAHVYTETGDYERAIETLHGNLQIAADIEYERVEFLSYGNLADTYLLMGDYEKALVNASQALRVSREAGFEMFEVYAYDLIGKAHLNLGDVTKGINYLEQALDLSRRVDSKVTESLNLLNLGQAYCDGQQFDQALDYLQQSIAIAQSIEANNELFKAHLLLSEIYEQQGDAAQALYHFKQYHTFKELVFGEKADQRLKVLQVAHDAETARQEAEIFQLRTVQLEQEIRERKQAETALQDAHDNLEEQVKERTADLSKTVDLLQHEIKGRERAEIEIQQMVEMLEQRVADRSRELAALYDMTILFTEAHTLTDMLEPALSNICQSVGGSAITVHLLSAERNQLHLSASQQLDECAQMQHVPLTGGLSSWLSQTEAPIMLVGKMDDHPFLPAELLPPGCRTYLGIALRIRDEVIGMLGVYRKEESPFDVKNVSLLITMAEQLGIIIQNHRLQEQSRRMTTAIERQRLARELHDSVAQRIYSLNLFARAGQDALADGDLEDAQLRLLQVEENARYSLHEMRLLLYQLRPLALEDQTLVEAIEERFALVERRLGIEAVIHVSADLESVEAAEEDLYYIITEALNNALKHAQATRVELRFDTANGSLSVTIQDNGQGFDLSIPPSGLGLESMRSRAAEINGDLAIETAVSQGTTIRITL